MTKTKNKFLLICILTLLLALLGTVLAGCASGDAPLDDSVKDKVDLLSKDSWKVESPDGNLDVNLTLANDGQLKYSVTSGDVAVLDNSSLGFVLEEDNLTQVLMFQSATSQNISGSYDNITGRNAEVDYNCNQTTLTFSTSLYYLDVVVRAYNDGYAFRYNIRQMENNSLTTATVKEENTTFRMPEDSIVWTQRYLSNLSSHGAFFSYEENYTSRRSSAMDNQLVVMPLMYRAGRSDVYSLITESELIGSDYWGSFLEDTIEDGVGEVKTIHNIAGAMENDNVISLPFESPWRVAAVGTLDEVVDSEIVEQVYDDAEYWKPEDYDTLSDEEKEIYTYDWVDPGLTAWNWLIESSYGGVGQGNWEMQYKYLDLAEDMGWKYTVLDGGWDQTMTNVKAFCDAAAQKGVKVIVWCDAYSTFGYGNFVEGEDGELQANSSLRNRLSAWASWGIAGIKIDFFDGQTNPGQLSHQGEDSLTIKWYEAIYQECARVKLLVNCHGCNKPTGERRVYPNVINREAILGNELYPADGESTVNNLFVRGSVGPTDFTPLVNPLKTDLTQVHLMALAALYESGLPSMAGRYTHYLNYADASNPVDNELTEFYKMLFVQRDETHFVEGALDGYYVSYSRSGDKYILAGVNGVSGERALTLDLSFLDEGNYDAIIYTDVASGDDYTTKKETKVVTSATAQEISMVANGGFVICLVPRAGEYVVYESANVTLDSSVLLAGQEIKFVSGDNVQTVSVDASNTLTLSDVVKNDVHTASTIINGVETTLGSLTISSDTMTWEVSALGLSENGTANVATGTYVVKGSEKGKVDFDLVSSATKAGDVLISTKIQISQDALNTLLANSSADSNEAVFGIEMRDEDGHQVENVIRIESGQIQLASGDWIENLSSREDIEQIKTALSGDGLYLAMKYATGTGMTHTYIGTSADALIRIRSWSTGGADDPGWRSFDANSTIAGYSLGYVHCWTGDDAQCDVTFSDVSVEMWECTTLIDWNQGTTPWKYNSGGNTIEGQGYNNVKGSTSIDTTVTYGKELASLKYTVDTSVSGNTLGSPATGKLVGKTIVAGIDGVEFSDLSECSKITFRIKIDSTNQQEGLTLKVAPKIASTTSDLNWTTLTVGEWVEVTYNVADYVQYGNMTSPYWYTNSTTNFKGVGLVFMVGDTSTMSIQNGFTMHVSNFVVE